MCGVPGKEVGMRPKKTFLIRVYSKWQWCRGKCTAGYAQVILFGVCHRLENVSCPPVSPVQDHKIGGGN